MPGRSLYSTVNADFPVKRGPRPRVSSNFGLAIERGIGKRDEVIRGVASQGRNLSPSRDADGLHPGRPVGFAGIRVQRLNPGFFRGGCKL